jgi:hypothetical protein
LPAGRKMGRAVGSSPRSSCTRCRAEPDNVLTRAAASRCGSRRNRRRAVIGATSREALVRSGELKPPSAGSKDSTARSVGFSLALRETV